MSKTASLGAYGIMYVIQTKRSQVINLLMKNGIVVPMNATDMQIALLVTDLLKVSKSFYKDFSALLISPDVVTGMSSNMSGSYANFNGFKAQTFENPFDKYDPLAKYGSTATTTTKDTPPESTSWLNKGLSLLQTGFNGYLQLDDNKTKRTLAEASVQLSENKKNTDETPPPPTGLSTGAIIALSVLGVGVVGLIIYLGTKKKA